MNNDGSQPQSGAPAHLPQVPLQPQAAGGALPAAQQAPVGADKVAAIAQAKQLIVQYRQSPFQLSEALQRLKGGYLAEQYNVSPNAAEK